MAKVSELLLNEAKRLNVKIHTPNLSEEAEKENAEAWGHNHAFYAKYAIKEADILDAKIFGMENAKYPKRKNI